MTREGKSNSKAKRNRRQRPSTAGWFPATEAVSRLTRLLGYLNLAMHKLAMHQLCKDIRSKGRKRLPAAIWCIRDGSETFERLRPSELESFDVESLLEANAAEIGDRPDGGFGTIDDGEHGGAEEQSAHAASAAPMCWLFVDRARFEKLHPDAAARAGDTMPPRAKPGPKPEGDWYTVLAAWLIEVACDDPKRLRNVDALVPEAQAFLRAKISWAPKEPKDCRQKIVAFLQLVPR